MLGSGVKEVEGSWSSVIWRRLGGKPSRPSTSSIEELEAGAAVDTLAVFKRMREQGRGWTFIFCVFECVSAAKQCTTEAFGEAAVLLPASLMI